MSNDNFIGNPNNNEQNSVVSNPNPYYTGFSGLMWIAQLIRNKWFILLSTFIVSAVSAFVIFQLPVYYASTISALPPKKSGGGMDGLVGGLSSSLKEFGLTKLAGKKDGSYEFMVILQSRSMLDSLIKRFNLAEVYNIPKDKVDEVRLELKDNLEITYEAEGNYTITATDTDPKRAAEIANASIEIANAIAERIDRIENKVILKQIEDKIDSTETSISRVEKELGKYAEESRIFSPLDQAKAAATELASMKADVMKQDVVSQLLQSRYGIDDPLTKQQNQVVSELQSKVMEIENKPGYIGNFSLKNAPVAAFKYLRLYTELETMYKLKAFLIPSYEQIKLDQVKLSYSLYSLDNATPPQRKIKPRRGLLTAGATLAAFIVACAIVIIRYQWKISKQAYLRLVNEKF